LQMEPLFFGVQNCFCQGEQQRQCNPGPLLGISWDNKLRMVNYIFVIVKRKRKNGKLF
jgi:hypothetical protein